MTASRVPEPQRYRQPSDRRNQSLNKGRQKASNQNVKRMPRTNSFPLPMWLRMLMRAQKLSIAATVLLTVSVFAIYGWTVYAQEQWNQQYKKLEQLKRQERQLTNAAGAFDNELLKSIQKQPGDLVRESPEKSIFLKAAPLRPKREAPSTISEMPRDKPNESLGY
ncbi:MAG: hypothetical protein DCE90_10480 [Pseudanabaena sp.]|nr:MAG: hypothetical protein DCE90_10480 [Pseudanabaena sp.]